MLNALFSGLTTKAAIASGLIGALTVGVPAVLLARSTGYNAGYTKAAKIHQEDAHVMRLREGSLWQELYACRVTNIYLVEQVPMFWDVTDAAREKMRPILNRYKNEARVAADSAAKAIQRLAEIDNAWKDVPVPRPVLEPFCLQDGARNCDPAAPGAGAPDGVALRNLAPGDGSDVDK